MPRNRFATLFALFLLALTLHPVSAQKQGSTRTAGQSRRPEPKPAAMTNRDVIKLAQAKISDEIIIAKIRQSQTNFDLSTDGIVQLKTAGVSEAVLKVMMSPPADSAQPNPASTQPAAQPAPARAQTTSAPKPEATAASRLRLRRFIHPWRKWRRASPALSLFAPNPSPRRRAQSSDRRRRITGCMSKSAGS